jgi:hypothetical protein
MKSTSDQNLIAHKHFQKWEWEQYHEKKNSNPMKYNGGLDLNRKPFAKHQIEVCLFSTLIMSTLHIRQRLWEKI